MNSFAAGSYAYKIGDFVMYKNNGICKITDIRPQTFGDGAERIYYVMCSVYDERSVMYVPTDAKDLDLNMRPILTCEEITAIIRESELIPMDWIPDSKKRSEYFESIMTGGNRAEILWLVKLLSIKKREAEETKTKFYAADAKVLAGAERIISEEFAFVLGLKKSEVIPYIADFVKSVG